MTSKDIPAGFTELTPDADAPAAGAPSLTPLENHLNGSTHNASSAIRALEAWVKHKVEEAIAELKGSSKTLSSNKDQQT
jgi:hypothetical protein